MSEAPLSVTELTARIKQMLEHGFTHLRVSGEVSRLTRPSSGHMYFTIKDQHAAISAVIWRSTAARLTTRPEEGEEFIFSGHLSVYEPRGSYQLVVTRVEAAGAGQLAAEFERRKQEFAKRGWFDPAGKQQPPAIPSHIGIVTSATAAAFEDVKKVLATRPGWLKLTHAPCLVQGNQAAGSIARAINSLSHMSRPPDVILLVRGGGSIEDLWCFNDEQVVKAIVDCPIPIISGIGHEIDVTLADFAADIRAATPSNAVEAGCPSRDELRERLPRIAAMASLMDQHMLRHRREVSLLMQRRQHSWERYSDARHHACDQLLAQLQHHARDTTGNMRRQLRQTEKQLARMEPRQRLRLQRRLAAAADTRLQAVMYLIQQQQRRRLHHWQEQLSSETAALVIQPEHALLHISQRLQRMSGAVIGQRREAGHSARHDLGIRAGKHIESMRQRLALLTGQLHALGPHQVLKRGYSLSYTAGGALITRASRLQPGDAMQVRFQDGVATTEVQSVSQEKT